jgi:hypothetical protein
MLKLEAQHSVLRQQAMLLVSQTFMSSSFYLVIVANFQFLLHIINTSMFCTWPPCKILSCPVS